MREAVRLVWTVKSTNSTAGWQVRWWCDGRTQGRSRRRWTAAVLARTEPAARPTGPPALGEGAHGRKQARARSAPSTESRYGQPGGQFAGPTRRRDSRRETGPTPGGRSEFLLKSALRSRRNPTPRGWGRAWL